MYLDEIYIYFGCINVLQNFVLQEYINGHGRIGTYGQNRPIHLLFIIYDNHFPKVQNRLLLYDFAKFCFLKNKEDLKIYIYEFTL